MATSAVAPSAPGWAPNFKCQQYAPTLGVCHVDRRSAPLALAPRTLSGLATLTMHQHQARRLQAGPLLSLTRSSKPRQARVA